MRWMEEACLNAIEASLPTGTTSVSERVAVTHVAPAPIGTNVLCTAKLVVIDARPRRVASFQVLDALTGAKNATIQQTLTFQVTCKDNCGEEIGYGTHIRVVVPLEEYSSSAPEGAAAAPAPTPPPVAVVTAAGAPAH